MPVERVHPRKVLLASLAGVRPDVEMELLVPLAVVLPREALAAPGPLALVRLLLRMRAQMTCAWRTHRPQAVPTRTRGKRKSGGRERGRKTDKKKGKGKQTSQLRPPD